MNQVTKKVYQAPKIERLGSLQQITLASTFSNSDVPQGTPGTAFPVRS